MFAPWCGEWYARWRFAGVTSARDRLAGEALPCCEQHDRARECIREGHARVHATAMPTHGSVRTSALDFELEQRALVRRAAGSSARTCSVLPFAPPRCCRFRSAAL